jgi:hypothetical protein
MGERESASAPSQRGVGIPAVDQTAKLIDSASRKLLGALPHDVRKSYKSESIRTTSKGPVLDTMDSSPADILIGAQTRSCELLKTVEGAM